MVLSSHKSDPAEAAVAMALYFDPLSGYVESYAYDTYVIIHKADA